MASSSYHQTPSSSGSTLSPTRWDVFLSFRGIDTRYSFTDYLYDSLDRCGIRTFMDAPELRSGEVISDALVQAIQDSRTYVVVFSENYASSRWCLDELVEILDCYKSKGSLIFPVFYNIEPSTVRYQTGSFNKAFQKHETRFDRDRLDKWRVTLMNVADLEGYTVLKNMSQTIIIKKVVHRVLLEINPLTLDVAKYPVGLDSRVKDIATLLRNDTEGVVRIGIHGMGGVGKTTLAKAVYNQNYQSYHGCCFLADVREVSRRENGIVFLQQKLIDSVLKRKNDKIHNVDQGIELIRARICSKKVLIVFDDLDNTIPLEFLEGRPFAPGSVIIITTRNEDLLDSIKVKGRYKVNELGDADSRQLFSQHAFGDNKIPDTFTELSQEILEHAGGLPLALKVFGSNLLNQPVEEYWRCFIDKLNRFSIKDVENKLVVSYEALEMVDPMLQNLYLDIACFFIGYKKKIVVKIMETCYTFVDHNFDILKKRCLLTTNDEDELGMHDLLRDMGRKIARNNFADEPGKHSRLWISKDIYYVLKKHTGKEAIECIIPEDKNQDALNGVSFAAETFKRMSKLRILYLNNVNLTGSFEQTFEDLRFLCWGFCPLKCLPSEFYPPKLVHLALPNSKMRMMWELNMVSEVFEKLKVLNMSKSLDLVTTPDFTRFPCLEILCLEHCESLEEVHISIGSLVKLVSLNLCGCVNLKSLPGSICNLRALERLNIGCCRSLEALPVELGNIRCLKEFKADGLIVSTLPDSIGLLTELVELKLSDNEKLETLPDNICNLRALDILSIDNCSSLKVLPRKLGNLESLTELNAYKLTVSKLPDSIGHLSKLVKLILCGNKNLESLPSTICDLRALKILNIDLCSRLEALPTELGNIKSLTELKASGLSVLELPDSIGHLSKLVVLNLGFNANLENLPDTICNLASLEILNIESSKKVEQFPDQLWKITSLRDLIAAGGYGTSMLKKLPDIQLSQIPSSLKKLDLSWTALNALPSGLSQLSNLEYLDLNRCPYLLFIAELPPNLKVLKTNSCRSMKRIPNISNLKKLEILDLSHCSGLTEIEGWKELTSLRELPPALKELRAAGCKSMLTTLSLSESKELIVLNLSHCSSLREIRGWEELKFIREVSLEGCSSSLLAYTLTKRFFQIFSRYGTRIHMGKAEFPNWISQSTYLGSSLSLDLLPNSSQIFLGMILCFNKPRLDFANYITTCWVKNATGDSIVSACFEHVEGAVMVIIPGSMFPVRDGDHKIELRASADIVGFYPLCKTEIAI